jgi:hypothetical protein
MEALINNLYVEVATDPVFAAAYNTATERHGFLVYGFMVRTFTAIKSKASSYVRLQETRCNFGLTARQESREARLEREITELANGLGLSVEFAGDPRGFCVRLLANNKSIGGF